MLKSILRKIFPAVVLAAAVSPLSRAAEVKPGIEVLAADNFAQLQGKRVGLITNPTGVDSHLVPTVDLIARAPGVRLTALFAPEHGIRGDVAAGAKVASTVDKATGVKVHSLYGATRRPTRAMLDGLDVLVYDIQDNGCRSYTFISTMAEAMEAAAKAGIEFMVLDRPNPLGGNRTEGCGVDSDCSSFVSALDIPYIYGLTPGELARYILAEGLIDAPGLKLTVIPMEGWRRDMTYGDTGLPWVLPSPHIPEASTCLYYPASGILGELDWLSIGVGYTLPFHTFAAPWIDAGRLADRLNASASQDGAVGWREIHYRPYYGKFKGEDIHGVELYFLDPEKASLMRAQFDVMEAIHGLYPAQSPLKRTESNGRKLRMFDQVTGTVRLRTRLLENGYNVKSVENLLNPADGFVVNKVKYHLYK